MKGRDFQGVMIGDRVMLRSGDVQLARAGTVLLMAAAVAGAVVWVSGGWKLGWSGPVPSFQSHFPWGAVRGLGAAALGAVLMAAAGWWLLKPVALARETVVMRLALAFVVGGAFSGLVLGWLGFVWIGPLMLIVPAVAAFGWSRRWARPVARRGKVAWTPEAVAAGIFLVLVLLAAFAPPVESDGLRYHLAAPQEWLRAGRFVHIPYSANSNLPALQGLLAASTGGMFELGRVYQAIHALHLVALAVFVGGLTEQVTRGLLPSSRFSDGSFPIMSVCRGAGAVLAAGTPVLAVVGAWPFADVASAAYLLGALWVGGPGAVRGFRGRLAMTSLLLGAALAAKLSALPLVGLAGCWFLVREGVVGRWRGGMGLRFALLIVPGALVLGPWLVKNVVYHGNPVYPVAWSVFGGEEWSAANDAFYTEKMAEKGFGRDVGWLVRSPWDVTVHWRTDRQRGIPGFEDHNPGPALLALFPAAVVAGAWLILQRRLYAGSGNVLLLFGLLFGGWAVWFYTYQSVRFLIPQLLLVQILGAGCLLALAARSGRPWWMSARCAIAGAAIAGGLWAPYYRWAVVPDFKSALGLFSNDFILARRFNAYPTVQWLNAEARDHEPVMYIGEFRTFYAKNFRPVASDWFDTPLVLTHIRETENNAELLARWRAAEMRFVLLNQAELRLYENVYFRPRFTEGEWARFEELRGMLLDSIVFDGGDGVFVAEAPADPSGEEHDP